MSERPTIPLTDGVYVDVSNRKVTRFGFSVIKECAESERHAFELDGLIGTQEAEYLACTYAKERWPGLRVFTDNRRAAEQAGVHWITRDYNKLAHKIARTQRTKL